MTKTVPVPIDRIVITISNDGGYLSGECIICSAIGVTVAGAPSSRFGYPFHVQRITNVKGEKLIMGNRLFHKAACPMNDILDSNGEPK